MFRILSEIDIKDFLKIINLKLKQPVIFKVKIEYLLFFYSRGNQLIYFLITKPGFTGAPHANDDIRLALYLIKLFAARRRFRQLPFMKIID